MFSSDYNLNFLKCQSETENTHIVQDPVNFEVNFVLPRHDGI
jgi:hypothetical protein